MPTVVTEGYSRDYPDHRKYHSHDKKGDRLLRHRYGRLGSETSADLGSACAVEVILVNISALASSLGQVAINLSRVSVSIIPTIGEPSLVRGSHDHNTSPFLST